MHKTFIALAIAIVVAGPVVASQETEVMAPVRQFINGFNTGDLKLTEAACDGRISIIDDFPPHVWEGSDAVSKWLHDLDTFEKKHGTSNPSVILGEPRHVDVTGAQAYVVVPTKISYKRNGQLVRETGLMTLALRKRAAGWRIAAWSWADN